MFFFLTINQDHTVLVLWTICSLNISKAILSLGKWLVNTMQMVQTAESFETRKDDCFESIYIPFNRFL